MKWLDEQDTKQLMHDWPLLPPTEQQHLLQQIEHIDLDILKQQKELLQQPLAQPGQYEPFLDFQFAGDPQRAREGQARLAAGQMGCLVLAGGEGSRLQRPGPKGTYPVSVIKHKSLFQLLAEKVVAASKQVQRPLALAIMTSPHNHEETVHFFRQHHYFGLEPEQLSFFMQGMLPLLDANGHLFLERRGEIAQGPDGNGRSLQRFVQAGIWSQWKQQGIRDVNVVLIDNPLADPFDAELLEFHCQQEAEVTLKCIEKIDPEEKVGVVVRQNQQCRVVEYSEMADAEKRLLAPDGRLAYRCANLSLFCFSMDFIHRVAFAPLPLHRAWKRGSWKFETFIFDILAYAKRTSVLLYPRSEVFAPLKNSSGDQSLKTVQHALQERDRQILQGIIGLDPPQVPFELAADFYYPTPNLMAKWRGRQITGGYIE